MLIACDLGNSFLKCALIDKHNNNIEIKNFWRLDLEEAPYQLRLNSMLHNAPIILMEVRPGTDGERLIKELKQSNTPVTRLTKNHVGWVPMAVQRQSVGLDRICNVISATHKKPQGYGAVVIDIGTALTIEVINPEGTFLGGAIAPGPEAAIQGLFLRAPKLSEFDISLPKDTFIGNNTPNALGVGKIILTSGAINFMLKQLKQELNYPFDIYITGGGAPLFLEYIEELTSYIPYLTIEGIALVAYLMGLVQ